MIFLDAGHCADKNSPNYDPGACANEYTEAEIAKKYRDIIKIKLHTLGATVITDNDKDSLKRVIEDFSISREGDIVLSIHLNAATPQATGVEAFYPQRFTNSEKEFADELVKGLSIIYGISNRGIKDETKSQHKRLGILKPNGLNCLIELGFITNAVDLIAINNKIDEACTFISNLLWKYELLFKPDGSNNK
jgi:N-acetylmuramoyl-L-alanine amidase